MTIFPKAGSVSYTRTSAGDNLPVFITMVPVEIKGSGTVPSLRTGVHLFTARTPALNVTVTDAVDMTVNKSLSGNYMISTFGHSPISIVMRGLDIFSEWSCNKRVGEMTIQQIYDKYNVHDNSDFRIAVGMNDGLESSAAFYCVMHQLIRDANSTRAPVIAGVAQYTLSMIGARL